MHTLKDIKYETVSIKKEKLFQNVFNTFVQTHGAGSGYEDSIFFHMVRQSNLNAKEFKSLATKLKINNTTSRLSAEHRNFNMYNLDMCVEWNPDNVTHIIKAAVELDIKAGEIIDYMYISGLVEDLTPVVESLISLKKFEVGADISWGFYHQLGIKSKLLEKQAWLLFESSDYSVKNSFGKLTNPQSKDYLGLIYYLNPGYEKVKDFYLLQDKNKPDAVRMDSLKYQLLYSLWENKVIESGIKNEFDLEVAYSASIKAYDSSFSMRHVSVFEISELLKRDSELNGPRFLKLVEIIHIDLLLDKDWCRPYIEELIKIDELHIIDIHNKILRTNLLYIGERNLKYTPYSEDFIHKVYLKMLELNDIENEPWCTLSDNYFTSMFNVSDNSGISNSPLYKPILATLLAYIAHDSSNSKLYTSKALLSIYPGLNTERGRQKLINIYFPEKDSIFNLSDLMSLKEIVFMATVETGNIEYARLPYMDV